MGREEGKKGTLFFSSSFPMSLRAPQPNPNLPSPKEQISLTSTEYDSGSVITILDTKEARLLSYCS